ncbi:MAG: hypothetical protein EPN21_20465 [Methylococcaceae bacterium]|nr:MAG: hypothetical protein EPN21_20465 [Methylococcaceae bacterium]
MPVSPRLWVLPSFPCIVWEQQKLDVLRVELRDLKVDLIKWMTGALIAQAAVIATLVKLL